MMAARRSVVLSVLVSIALSTFAVAAAADSPSPEVPRSLGDTLEGDAKRDYDAALLLYKAGDFAGAERRFSSAFETSSDVRLLWNAAACEQALRHYAKAIALVRRYLDSHSPLITPEAEQNAYAFLDAAVPLTARLVIEATPSDASAYLDDDPLGPLPLAREARVDFGTHRLIVRKAEFRDRVQDFTVTSSADVVLKVGLEPVVHQGRLVVRASKGDSIALDGRFVALTSFDGAVASGTHALRVTASGARAYEARVRIEDDRTRAIDVVLEPVAVTSGVPAWVWLAGGAVLVAGATTAGYFALRSSEPSDSTKTGSIARVDFPLR